MRWRADMLALAFQGATVSADGVEAYAEPWATPRAWAEKMGHDEVVAVLREHGS